MDVVREINGIIKKKGKGDNRTSPLPGIGLEIIS
tara:strand:+ start:1617 stop:1718 length:102 start_codon:yes stop_codon:yes gene_type:complete